MGDANETRKVIPPREGVRVIGSTTYRWSDVGPLPEYRPPDNATPPTLIDRVRQAIRARHYSRRTEAAYVGWVHRYVAFHRGRPPEALGAADVSRFLSTLATVGHVAASTQNQAFSALLFLYREVLNQKLAGLDVVRAKRPVRLPQVLSRDEVATILQHMRGTTWLMASLMYGAGLRVLECVRLRVKDVDLARTEIMVRDGKGRKDRVTVLPLRLVPALRAHLGRVRQRYDIDLTEGGGFVALPDALERKYCSASREWGWQWIFPATRSYVDRGTAARRRHHLHESALQRSFKEAVLRAGLAKPASCHTLRHYAGCRIMPGSSLRAA